MGNLIRADYDSAPARLLCHSSVIASIQPRFQLKGKYPLYSRRVRNVQKSARLKIIRLLEFGNFRNTGEGNEILRTKFSSKTYNARDIKYLRDVCKISEQTEKFYRPWNDDRADFV